MPRIPSLTCCYRIPGLLVCTSCFGSVPDRTPVFDVNALEATLRNATRAWTDHLLDAVLEHMGEERGIQLMRKYGEAFRADYREAYAARMAVADIEHMEALGGDNEALALSLFRPLESAGGELRFKLFRRGRPFPLSRAVPMLENMGVLVEDEHPCKIKVRDGSRVWIHDFGLRYADAGDLDVDRIRTKFQHTFDRVWHDEAENDGFNRLVLRAELSWRDIVILRACCKYLRQVGIAFSQTYMEQALHANPNIASLLVQLFHSRLDPAFEGDRQASSDALAATVVEALDAVANLDEDRILRAYLGLIQSVLRTNFYQLDQAGEPRPYVSFKLDPEGIADLPEPRPMYEIFVYSTQVEGVHLRGGPWPGADCAGRTGGKTSVPRCWGWSKRKW